MRVSRDRQQRQHFISSVMLDHRPHVVAHHPRHVAAGGPDEQLDWLQDLSCPNSIYQVYPQHTRNPQSHSALYTQLCLPMALESCNRAGETENTNCIMRFNFFKVFLINQAPRGSHTASTCYWVNKYPLAFHFFHFFQRDYIIWPCWSCGNFSVIWRGSSISPQLFKPSKNNQAKGMLTCKSLSHQNIFCL